MALCYCFWYTEKEESKEYSKVGYWSLQSGRERAREDVFKGGKKWWRVGGGGGVGGRRES